MNVHEFLEKRAGRTHKSIVSAKKRLKRIMSKSKIVGPDHGQRAHNLRNQQMVQSQISDLLKKQKSIYRDPNIQSLKELRATVDDKGMKDKASRLIRESMANKRKGINKDISSGPSSTVKGGINPKISRRKRAEAKKRFNL